MHDYTREDILRIVEEEDVAFIRLQFTDLFGGMKNLAITASHLKKALDNQVIFDGSSINGFVDVEESDLYLCPDYNTLALFPWRPQQGRVARLICDVYRPDGSCYEGDPRYILKKVVSEAAGMGYTFQVGPECEFFLFHLDDDARPTTISHEQAGYFDVSPLDLGENARRDIVLTLEEMGFEIEASHHECAVAQHEIDFKYSDALSAADNILTFKMVVKSAADSHGLCATFMPKPLFGQAGSGMHTNMSLFSNGKNAFYDPESPTGLSRIAYNFIAGILAHIRGMSALTNPLVNSYKRLVPGYEAPCYIAWTASNRSALVRVPATRGMGTRVELRSPDPACNPYLELAVLLAAGLEGIRKDMTPPEPVSANIYDMSEQERLENGIENLPSTLLEAINYMKADPFIREVLGDHAYDKYTEAKKLEWDEYSTRVSQWEIDRYLSKF